MITNEFTTELTEDINGEIKSSVCVPGLGVSFFHKINQRIILNRHPTEKGLFRAKIVKSLLTPRKYAEFWV